MPESKKMSEPIARLPTVVIAGRPNVGKSTLFNRIVGRRIAVVEDTPGITRDRLYAEAEWRGRRFTVVDTGGLTTEPDVLWEQIRLQATIALQEADVVLFLVDACDGLCPADRELADELRPLTVPVVLVVNKADNPRRAAYADEFYALGFGEPRPVSSLHGRGVAEVLDDVVNLLPEPESLPEDPEPISLAILGRPNVGKSSLQNAILGQPRAIVSDIPGTTRDAVDTPFTWKGEPLKLVDTAGLRRPGKVQGSVEYYMALRATRAAERADVCLAVIDASEGFTDGDKRVGSIAYEAKKALVWVANKWDIVEPPDGRPTTRSQPKRDFARTVQRDAPEQAFAPICFTSATQGTGIEALMDTCIEAYENYSFRITTGVLNRIIHDATFEKPLTVKGRALKAYYATMTRTRPPTIAVFVNDPKLVHFSYRRYLQNRLRKEYPLEGAPLVLDFRASHQRKP
ncbi:MAG: GTPase Der [Fimbriimonadales bacterium]